MAKRTHVVALTIFLIGISTVVQAQGMTINAALKAIESYSFVLPAIDCYRTSSLKFTTSKSALEKLLSSAMASVPERKLDEIKNAAVRGASKYDQMIAASGKQKYCFTVVQRFGPRGTVVRGLVVERAN